MAATESRQQGAVTVLHSTSEWLPLTQTWLNNLTRYLPSDEAVSVVFCLATRNLEQFPKIPLYRVRGSGVVSRALHRAARSVGWDPTLSKLSAVLDREGPGLVHSHFGDWACKTLPAIEERRLPHVVSFYGWDMSLLPHSSPEWRERYLQLFQVVSGCLCEGPHMASELVKLGCPEDRVKVQHLGVELERLPFRPRLLGRGDPLRVLIAGSFREKKGIPYAVEALGRVSRLGVPLEITMVGDAGNLPSAQREKERILEAVSRSGLVGVTRFLGYQPYQVLLEEAYRHHVFLSPSVTASDGDTEGGAPVAILEMAATGMPIVTTTHCDIPYVLGGLDGGGLFAPERDPDLLTEHLVWLFENPEKWGPRLEKVRGHLERVYDWREVGQQLMGAYRGILTEVR